MHLYPIHLNLKDRICVIIGGGKVAARKAQGLKGTGAFVRIISPEVVPEIEQLVGEDERIDWFDRGFGMGDLRDAFLAYAATDDPMVQYQIRQEAAKSQVLLNIVDCPEECDFHVPGHFRRGDVMVTVATGGESPALSAELRRRLEEVIGPEYDVASKLLGLLRERVQACNGDSESNGQIFKGLLNDGIVEMSEEGDWLSVQRLLMCYLPKGLDAGDLLQDFLIDYDGGSLKR